jgi:peptidoglycan/LPS O-acetylase OafA/YrhL
MALALAVPLDAWTWRTRGGNPAYALLSIGMTLLVLGAALLPASVARPVVPLRALGVVSYGVFLYHQLTLELAERWIPGAAGVSLVALGLTAAVGLGLACFAGAVSFYLVEAPALAFVSRWLRKTAPHRRDPRAIGRSSADVAGG